MYGNSSVHKNVGSQLEQIIKHPKLPEIIMNYKNIRDVDMPLSFLVCLTIKNPELRDQKFKDAGYNNIHSFFAGRNMHNDSIVGWFGHMKNGSTYNSLEGMSYIYIHVFTRYTRLGVDKVKPKGWVWGLGLYAEVGGLPQVLPLTVHLKFFTGF